MVLKITVTTKDGYPCECFEILSTQLEAITKGKSLYDHIFIVNYDIHDNDDRDTE